MKNEGSVGGSICSGEQGSISADYPHYAQYIAFHFTFFTFLLVELSHKDEGEQVEASLIPPILLYQVT